MNNIFARGLVVYGPGWPLIITTIVCTIVAGLFVSGRACVHAFNKKKMHWDDWVIIASLAADALLAAANFVAVGYGYGSPTSALSPRNARIALWAFMATQVCYKLTLNLTKVSICLLLLRVFAPPGTTSWLLRRKIYAIMFFVIGYGVGSILASILQCVPFTRYIDKTLPGTCLNVTAFWYTNAITNIVSDIIIVTLPIPAFISLQVPRRQKIGAALVFMLGGAVTIFSAARFVTLHRSAKDPDPLFGTMKSTIWTTVEANVGICCSCLPLLKKPLFDAVKCIYGIVKRLFPCLFRPAPTLTARLTRTTPRNRLRTTCARAHTANNSAPAESNRGRWTALGPRGALSGMPPTPAPADNADSADMSSVRQDPPRRTPRQQLRPGDTNFQETGESSIPMGPMSILKTSGFSVEHEDTPDLGTQVSGRSEVSFVQSF